MCSCVIVVFTRVDMKSISHENEVLARRRRRSKSFECDMHNPLELYNTFHVKKNCSVNYENINKIRSIHWPGFELGPLR